MTAQEIAPETAAGLAPGGPGLPGWEVVVGLETHVQLLTASKMFCGCSADYDGAEPNTHVCPVCLGLPGTLPAPNEAAVAYIVRIGLALGCDIASVTHFDRKNYHYPDLPKGYQISQYDEPVCRNGSFTFLNEAGRSHSVGIERVHLEEDTGKSTHVGASSFLDFNRSGVPLVEVVTRPDLRAAQEARDFLEALRQLLRWLGVSTGNMEAGALRADVNVSVRRTGATELGTKVELKNLNSFGAVKAAIDHEAARLVGILETGGTVRHETRGWSEAQGRTVPQRTKELAEDYRYFPEPDLPPLTIDPSWVEGIRGGLPELPVRRRIRFAQDYGLDHEAARLLTRDADIADYFETAIGVYSGEPQELAGWITGPLFGLLNATNLQLSAAADTLPPGNLAELATLVDHREITRSAGKDVLERMLADGDTAREIVSREGLGRIDSSDELAQIVADVVDANPDALADYCGGKATAIGFFIGRVMRATRGQSDPNLARELLQRDLDRRCGE
jgi:aspartyl-tRNA(Asn)/glutamyl-tRNA(Gln) amidotransferase subunit B